MWSSCRKESRCPVSSRKPPRATVLSAIRVTVLPPVHGLQLGVAVRNVVVVMPAYNAASTVERTYADLPLAEITTVVLVDDASTDDTVAVATALGITVIRHETNQGYGANQKTCYAAALDLGADIVVMLHPDFQYDSRIAPVMAVIIELGICDVVL